MTQPGHMPRLSCEVGLYLSVSSFELQQCNTKDLIFSRQCDRLRTLSGRGGDCHTFQLRTGYKKKNLFIYPLSLPIKQSRWGLCVIKDSLEAGLSYCGGGGTYVFGCTVYSGIQVETKEYSTKPQKSPTRGWTFLTLLT